MCLVRMLVLTVVTLALVGCSKVDTEPRFRVSGKVTFGGQPVPHGEVLFTPDGSKGNSGVQGIATIQNGMYDTTGSRAPGISGGPTVVRVTALSDARGKLIAEYEYSIDLPKSATVHDIDVPAKAAERPTAESPAQPEI